MILSIYKLKSRHSTLPENANFPCIALTADSWNDYGYNTLFAIECFTDKKTTFLKSTIKILQKNPDEPSLTLTRTIIRTTLDGLSENYCSLGQDTNYYKQLQAAGPALAEGVLLTLRDAAYFPAIRNQFENLLGFSESVMRFGDAHKALKEGRNIILSAFLEKNLDFIFSYRMPSAESRHSVEFEFNGKYGYLLRSVVLIGRNGTGKTEYLAALARAISGNEEVGNFSPSRPTFSKVIAVSYSVFDVFQRPIKKERKFSYIYCGLRRDLRSRKNPDPEDPLLSQTELMERLLVSIERISNLNRTTHWKEIISGLFESDLKGFTKKSTLEELNFYTKLSSGQRVLVCVITEIIANITDDSLILFDEPELHLHPDIFSSLIGALNKLLVTFNSYAIYATHSPLLLQETPARQVRIFRRLGNTPSIMPLSRESLGENLTTLTQEVFEAPHAKNDLFALLESLKLASGESVPTEIFSLGLPIQIAASLRIQKARSK